MTNTRCFFFRSRGYWGGLLLAASFPIFLFSKYLSREPAPTPPLPPVRTNTPSKVVTQVVEMPEPAVRPPIELLELRVEGFVLNGPRSTVVLNGRTVSLGESFQGVKVVSITPAGIVVEMGGQRKWLTRGL